MSEAVAKKILQLLEKHQLLLLQDQHYPSVVRLIVGSPVKGSWWGHPMGNTIYNGLSLALDRYPILTTKLISGKTTFVAPSLAPTFLSVVTEEHPWQLYKLPPEALKLFKLIKKKGSIQSDDLSVRKVFPEFKKNVEQLEKRLLIHSSEEHGDSGKHFKFLSTWEGLMDQRDKAVTAKEGMEQIEELVRRENQKCGSKLKLPWE